MRAVLLISVIGSLKGFDHFPDIPYDMVLADILSGIVRTTALIILIILSIKTIWNKKIVRTRFPLKITGPLSDVIIFFYQAFALIGAEQSKVDDKFILTRC